MPLHLHFTEDAYLASRFAISPLWETQEAVRTLKRPDRHGYHPRWLRRIKAAEPPLDLSPVWLLMPQRGHSPDWLGPPPLGPAATFAEEIAAVRTADPAMARAEMAVALGHTPGAARTPLARELLADPARAVQRLADLLEQAWHTLVEPDWPRLRALLEADVAYHSRRLADIGLGALLGELDRRLSWSDRTLTLEYHSEHVRRLDGRGLVLMPSVFSWPDVISGYDPPWQPTLVYPVRGLAGLWAGGPAPDAVRGALVRLLGRGRAAVLTALDEPASTTALALRLDLAPSSVSAHLTALRDTGLLTSRRYGHQVLYERSPLGMALLTAGE
ncbi:ArsR/SmtB family transcription factor [Streptomyces uncialis]|uniref:ArsR family transcriptional regulator n=1 Tax=Streptomyces uncialis TaxID=1048205 RepID=A0A1Q4VFF0_9ACTN|nr:DUF5937 family protein [Streptomyces uncialis]MCX4660021.1 DUF5937 family protein [Streptomyces uncialis]OKH96546.1 ArsR family transcriptional regulator [Streptomyces uncialis]WTE13278.1 DUF5937 family protein [Streptomyces uncialis]